MSSTSQKHRNFVKEPMRGKRVTELPGVGNAIGQRLNAAGYDRAESMLGQYLHLKKDKGSFQAWMKTTSNANSKQSSDAYQCIKDWSEEFL
uniref:Barrier-to-autointegration factor 1 n=1 Tax=Nyssomyia neivai TaxID=330878 RepID=A0A1L8DX06_9DIPT